jgi:sulfoxide reductase heme-binding subunit YedZ
MDTNLTPHLFWITSRAAGIAALVAASLAVSLGLLMSTKLLRRRGADLRVTHEALSLATMFALVVHGLSLIGDKYLHPSLLDVAVPFVGSYKTFWTSLGIIGGWGMILLGLGFYARRRIGVQRWRKLHRFTALAWVFGLAHALGEGTDAGQLWFLAMIAIVAIPALILLATRYATEPADPGRSAGGQAAPEPAAPSAYSPAGWRSTMPANSPPPWAQRVPVSARATVSKRQPATTIQA